MGQTRTAKTLLFKDDDDHNNTTKLTTTKYIPKEKNISNVT